MKITTPVLMLHHVEPGPLEPAPLHPDSYLTPGDLGRLLDLLGRGRFVTLTLAEAARAWHAGRKLPRRSLVLTFDDGCRCFATNVLPALAACGRTATLFALSGVLGGTNDWDRPPEGPAERREQLLTSEELCRAAADPAAVEIGCHGHLHRSLPECDERGLHRETAEAKETLETVLGRKVETFCYPWGRSGPRVRAAVRAAGFLAAAGIEGHPGAAAGDPWGLPRIVIRPGDSRFELWLKATGAYRLWRRLPRLGLLAALRRSRDGIEGNATRREDG